jgi:hypothetical protein
LSPPIRFLPSNIFPDKNFLNGPNISKFSSTRSGLLVDAAELPLLQVGCSLGWSLRLCSVIQKTHCGG